MLDGDLEHEKTRRDDTSNVNYTSCQYWPVVTHGITIR